LCPGWAAEASLGLIQILGVMEFKTPIFQGWEVMESNLGPGKSRNHSWVMEHHGIRPRSWEVMEPGSWNVMESDLGHGKSCYQTSVMGSHGIKPGSWVVMEPGSWNVMESDLGPGKSWYQTWVLGPHKSVLGPGKLWNVMEFE